MRLPSNWKEKLEKDRGWFAKIVTRGLGKVHDYYVGEIGIECKAVFLRFPTIDVAVDHDEEQNNWKFKTSNQRTVINFYVNLNRRRNSWLN